MHPIEIIALGVIIFIISNMALLLVYGWPAMALAMLGKTGMAVFMIGTELHG